MAWFRKPKQKLRATERRDLPTDVFEKCPGCSEILYREKLAQNRQVCPECGHHFRISADEYVDLLVDEGTFLEADQELRSADPLGFTDLKPYVRRLADANKKAAHGDAVLTGQGHLDGVPISLAVMDFSFIGGSMGSVVGEKIARAARRALGEGQPLVVVSASGGARMQEGILSLMQMAKTSAALADLHDAGVPFISILTDPTTGGVTASFAMLGDAILAEPGALVGFAGPRVIEQTIKQELPDGFQRSEFLLQHGMVDRIVDRRALKQEVSLLLRHMLGLPPAGNGDGPAGGAQRDEGARATVVSAPRAGAEGPAVAPAPKTDANGVGAAPSPRAATDGVAAAPLPKAAADLAAGAPLPPGVDGARGAGSRAEPTDASPRRGGRKPRSRKPGPDAQGDASPGSGGASPSLDA